MFGLRAVGNNERGYFVYTLAGGASQSGAVIVSNVGTAAGTVKLFTADATTGRTTGTVYETDTRPTRTGSWVKLSRTSLTLAAGAHQTVSFTVHVPAGTPVGQWVGGIVAETFHAPTSSKSNQKANVQIKIRDLTIVAVQANVPGPQRVKFTFGKVSTGGQRGFQQVFVHISSLGNVLTKPAGKVTILDTTGKAVETLSYTMDTFLPQTAIDYPILLKKALAPGDYRAVTTLTAAGGDRRCEDVHGLGEVLGLEDGREAGLHLGQPHQGAADSRIELVVSLRQPEALRRRCDRRARRPAAPSVADPCASSAGTTAPADDARAVALRARCARPGGAEPFRAARDACSRRGARARAAAPGSARDAARAGRRSGPSHRRSAPPLRHARPRARPPISGTSPTTAANWAPTASGGSRTAAAPAASSSWRPTSQLRTPRQRAERRRRSRALVPPALDSPRRVLHTYPGWGTRGHTKRERRPTLLGHLGSTS